MGKPRVVFPFVEAGFGHIMTERSICDAFEKKYGEYFEIIRSNFYTESGSEPMKQFEQMLCQQVRWYNKCHFYGYLNIVAMNVFGTKIASDFVMKKVIKGAYQHCMQHMEELQPDVVVSTHWATNYYAENLKNKPYTVICQFTIPKILFCYIGRYISLCCCRHSVSIKRLRCMGISSAAANKYNNRYTDFVFGNKT